MAKGLIEKIGRWVSILGHPFIVTPAAIVVSTSEEGAAMRLRVLAIVFASTLILGIFIVRRARRGEFTDVDVSVRQQRPAAFAVALLCSSGAGLALWATGQPPLAVRGAICATGLFGVAAVANRWVKVSLHCAFDVLAAGVAWHTSYKLGLPFAALALLVGWGRVAYGRHTRLDVAVGLALGAVAAVGYALPRI